ncbi:MAG: hypothetical protein HY273_16920 [Gammaproteobacteria bacterium]|nr:hypothetical protein [Gammaproteobacteria bacterium]
MNIVRILISAVSLLILVSCANVRGPVPASLSAYTSPEDVGVYLETTKRGEACLTNILGLVATGDASIDAAKKAGNITRIASVESTQAKVLGYYARFCTVVIGD